MLRFPQRKLTRAAEVQCYLTNNQVTWNSFVKKEPWWGGWGLEEDGARGQEKSKESYRASSPQF